MPLQEQEIFVPLTSGVDTEGDARVPSRGTLTAENVSLQVKNRAVKRDPLLSFVGDSDDPTDIGTGNQYMATSGDGSSVVFFGNDVRESSGISQIVNSYSTVNGYGSICDIQSDKIFHLVDAGRIAHSDCSFAKSTNSSESDIILIPQASATGSITQKGLYVIGEDSGRVKASADTEFLVAVETGVNGEAYAVGSNVSIGNVMVANWDMSTLTESSAGAAPTNMTGTVPHDAIYVGTLGGTKRAAMLSRGSNTTVVQNNIDLETPTIKATNYRTHTGTTLQFYGIQGWDLDNSQTISYNASRTTTTGYYSFDIQTWDDTGIILNHTGSFSESDSGGDEYTPWHVSVIKDSTTTGRIIYSYFMETNGGSRFQVKIRPITDISGGTITIGSATYVSRGMTPMSIPFQDDNSNWYQLWEYNAGRWYDDVNRTSFDRLTRQNFFVLMRFTGSTTKHEQVTPVGLTLNNHPWVQAPQRTPLKIRDFSLAKEGPDDRMAVSVQFRESAEGFFDVDSDVVLMGVNFARQDISGVEHDGVTMIPNSFPYLYDGRDMRPMSSMEYPEGMVLSVNTSGSGTWATAGGVGDYTYTCTFVGTDRFGREIESAPAPSVTVNVNTVTYEVDVEVPVPFLEYSRAVGGNSTLPYIRIYRTNVNGNDFFEVGRAGSTASAFDGDYATFSDTGGVGITNDQGLDRIFSTVALYTSNGELENSAALPHRISESHQDRYFYVHRDEESTDIYYSKAIKPRISPEFNNILKIVCSSNGGPITGLKSFLDKLWIFKNSSIYVTYGSPLNDAGSGSGYEPPRIASREAGLSRSTAAAVGQPGIVFVNSVDGEVYLLSGNEQVQYIGGPVRFYTTKYEYTNVFFAPQSSSIFVTSQTAGAPSLEYNYRYGVWTTHTGRYSEGIYDAFSSKVGSSYGYGSAPLNVVLTKDRNSYIQEPKDATTKRATQENYKSSITTAWFSLSQVLGYGRLYRWWLLLGKRNKDFSMDVSTAYDYAPYWLDTVTIDDSKIEVSPDSDHYEEMDDVSLCDEAAKFELDGSRHKTDAVRMRIREKDGTARDSFEIVGLRMLMGIKPGGTRLGEDRHNG